MMLVLVAWAARPDLLGVTSFVRASFLDAAAYHPLLAFFHSRALPLPALLRAWVQLALTLFRPVTEGGYVVFVADGLKVGKEGRKMPAVKSLHQESENNSKAEYIMGHSFQVLALLAQTAGGQVLAVPLLARICEGLVGRRADARKSQLVKLADMFLEVTGLAAVRAVLVADAYYASRTVIEPLLARGHHLISRARKNAVAYEPAPSTTTKRRGRPKKYGRKVRLRDLFKAWQSFTTVPSPVYGEKGIALQYRSVDLLWRPVGRSIRFVLVKHPTRGRLILLSSSCDLDPVAVIKLYGLRFKIEVSFKQALNTVGGYAYHFWMMAMTPIRRGAGNQHIDRRTTCYQKAVARKLDAYHRYVQLACIVQGLLQHLAVNLSQSVWAAFGSWLRTMRKDLVPSEMVVAHALRAHLPEFLLDTSGNTKLQKFILSRAHVDRMPGFQMAE
ncbi:MAG: transposase [Nitrospinae bacterium]|nr:transposase [Nitrospinota bacterium]